MSNQQTAAGNQQNFPHPGLPGGEGYGLPLCSLQGGTLLSSAGCRLLPAGCHLEGLDD